MKITNKTLIIGTVITLALIGLVAVWLCQYDKPLQLGGTDPSCDYNTGTKSTQGYSTCSLDYKTKIHPWPDNGSTKNINFHCENGYFASASYSESSTDIVITQESEEDYNNCREPPVHQSCSLKFTNNGVSNHHVTTHSITCAPD